MKVNNISGISSQLAKPAEIQKKRADSFGEMFTGFVKDVNTQQQNSIQITEDFVTGKDVELHEVMIAGQKARTSLDLLMELRNKTIDMYRELTRMQ